MTEADAPVTGATSGSCPVLPTPEPVRNARCSAETDGPAGTISHPTPGSRQKKNANDVWQMGQCEADAGICVL